VGRGDEFIIHKPKVSDQDLKRILNKEEGTIMAAMERMGSERLDKLVQEIAPEEDKFQRKENIEKMIAEELEQIN
jgi:hypothetical protein